MREDSRFVTSRKEAIAVGDSHYFTGKPCTHGHIAKRITVNGNCHECNLVVDKMFRAKNLDARRDSNRKSYREKSPIKIKQATEWAHNNPDKVTAYAKKFREKKRLNAEYDHFMANLEIDVVFL